MKNLFKLFLLSSLIVSSCTVPGTNSFTTPKGQKTNLSPLPFKTVDDYIAIENNGVYKPFFIKGVNFGVATPGKQPGELDVPKSQYLEWFKFVHEMGVNTIRVYTIHRPQFYQALDEFNTQNKGNPLYVLHGIWLDDNVNTSSNLADISNDFTQNMKEAVDCVHGNIDIPQRYGKGYGKYEYDISPWVIGWIIGREVAPVEIIDTNTRNSANTNYTGKNISITGSPSEYFVTKNLDELITYEKDSYKVQRPVSFSSWPTLDPLDHPTEDKIKSSEDIVSLDLSKIKNTNASGGVFVSYHAYPYYPDFINESPEYQNTSDSVGKNNYIPYLTALKNHYKKMPLVIAEYGVPSSWGNAHFSYSGMDHGGHDEVEQGQNNARLIKSIYQTKAGGGILFNLIDEWWKKTWIVMPFSTPYDRFRLWHNLGSPEQNYGLIAYKPEEPVFTGLNYKVSKGNQIQKIETGHNAEFFYANVYFNSDITNKEVTLGFDTYKDDAGEVILPNKIKTQQRSEFSLVVKNSQEAQLYVTQAYDLFGISTKTSNYDDANLNTPQLFKSTPSEGGVWSKVRWRTDIYYTVEIGKSFLPHQVFEAGKLRVSQNTPKTSLDYVVVKPNKLEVKIPWSLLQFADPSTLSVINDERQTNDVRETATSEGIAVSASVDDSLAESQRYKWAGWNYPPKTTQVVKEGVKYFKEAIKGLPDFL
ncbi:hypothetical protein EON78_01525 [bacterium]|nr:MAG: hypothetical protein EON78_01525 [bacterium]